MPVRIRGRRNNGRGYERLDYLPVTSLNVGLQRQNDGLSEGQVARNVKQAVLQKLGSPSEDDAIMELSEEVYFLDARRQPHACGNEPAAAARRPARGLLPALQGRRDPGLGLRAAGRQALRGPAAGGAAAADFDTICDRGWQERGVTPEEIRKFCVWRGAPMLFVNCQGQLLDSYQPAVKEARAVAFTAWQGHAFFYKNARSVFQRDDAERLRPRFRSERRESAVPEGGPLLDAGPAGGAGRAAGCGALPQQGCHTQFVRVAQPAAAGG